MENAVKVPSLDEAKCRWQQVTRNVCDAGACEDLDNGTWGIHAGFPALIGNVWMAVFKYGPTNKVYAELEQLKMEAAKLEEQLATASDQCTPTQRGRQ